MRPQILLLTIFLAVLPLSAIATVGRKLADGRWVPIKDVHDPHVQAIAKFAVSRFNSRNHTDLVFKDITRGETLQADGGTNYFLHLLMAQPSSPCYAALVLRSEAQPCSFSPSGELLSYRIGNKV
ncbi:cysteine proteinase inhibitor 1-like [Syzygium oleosum]|uniref:cysteine proteinase inhibitor 1-like n=1 Tax=Syzygium oleosum TaxID=219896 RepID=UPI0024B95EA8|nr:cysteine proteinase inhibitor 1-like [Syzygium oleosum]